jgi:hypothetical protein
MNDIEFKKWTLNETERLACTDDPNDIKRPSIMIFFDGNPGMGFYAGKKKKAAHIFAQQISRRYPKHECRIVRGPSHNGEELYRGHNGNIKKRKKWIDEIHNS